MEIRKKENTLKGLFLKFIAVFCISSLLLLAAVTALFMAMVQSGLILPANYAEVWLSSYGKQICEADRVGEELLPPYSRYGIYSSDGEWLYGDFQRTEQKEAWQDYQKGNIYAPGGWYYRSLRRDNGEICLVKYRLVTRYSNEKMNQWLIRPEAMLPVLYILLFALNAYLLSRRFGNRLKEQLQVLQQVTEKIAENDLNFTMEPSRIKEINEIMFSFGKLKEALSQSLKEQWDMEQRRQKELSALAHDIKTPLTVIRGNGELLIEGELSLEDKENVEYILENTREIDGYLQKMRQLLLGREESSLPKREQCQSLTGEMIEAAKRLCAGERLTMTVTTGRMEGTLMCVKEELLRAWENLVSNGAEHTDREKGLHICIQVKEKDKKTYLTAEVRDYGKGFTGKDLLYADQEFYSGDESRHDRSHQGLGLSIAKGFVKRQGGFLEFKNAEDGTGGAAALWMFMEI